MIGYNYYMIKILTILLSFLAVFILILAIKNAYSVKANINSIQNRKSYLFVITNIAVAVILLFCYIIYILNAIRLNLSFRDLFISSLFLLNAVFIFYSSIITQKMGRLLYKIDELRKIDSLTGIYNRGYIERAIKKEHQRCLRYNHVASIIMIDINDFKFINDSYGHLTGDNVLVDLANTITKECRENDIVGRYGGDEFFILMPETDKERAKAFASRLIKVIEQKHTVFNNTDMHYTVSLGIASLDLSKDRTYQLWMHNADKNLYRAKAKFKASLNY